MLQSEEDMMTKQADLGPSPRKILLRLPKEMADELINEAREAECSINALIVSKLAKLMGHEKKRRK